MFLPVFIDLFLQLFIEEFGGLLCHKYLLCLLAVGCCLDMCRIHIESVWIHQSLLHALIQDMCEDLLEQVSSFEPPFVVLAEGAEVRHIIEEVKTQEPSVCHINFDFFYGLAHTLDAEHTLDYGYLDKCHRIYTWTTVISRVFIFHQIIDERKVDITVDLS